MIMKKLFLYALAAAMVTFAGCQKNEMEGVDSTEKGGSTFEIVADIAQDATKTTLDAETYKVDWEANDVIYVVTSGNDAWATAQSFTYTDGSFKTEAEIADGNYTMNALYCTEESDQAKYHKNSGTTHKLNAMQTQDCDNPTVHVKENDALVGTFGVEVPTVSLANVKMQHLYTLMQVDIKNTTEKDIEVTEFSMTAEGADLAGIFTIKNFATPEIEKYSQNTETITVSVENGNVANGGTLPVYFVMAPLSNYSGNVTFKVTDSEDNTYSKTLNLSNLTFVEGRYNTTTYEIVNVDPVTSITWDLATEDTTYEANEDVISWDSNLASMKSTRQSSSTTAANNYYPGKGNTSTRFYKNNSLVFTPKTDVIVTYVTFVATTENYATVLKNSTWTNATAFADGTNVYVIPKNGSEEFSAVIGGTCGFYSVTVHTDALNAEKLAMGEVTCSGQTENTLTFSWSSVSGATDYHVSIDGGNTYSSTSQSTQYIWTGLEAETEYTIYVKAIGNGIDYSDSDPIQAVGTTSVAEVGGGDVEVEPGTIFFTEDFSSLTTWSTTSKAELTINGLTWATAGGTMYEQNGCIKMGKSSAASNVGVVMPKIADIDGKQNVVLTFKAVSSDGAYSLSVSANDGAVVGELTPSTITKHSSGMNNGASTATALSEAFASSTAEFSVDITGMTSNTVITIKASSSAKRWYIDDIKISAQ